MIILIDYDNLHNSLKHISLQRTIKTILSKLNFSQMVLGERVSCRLYGGWMHWINLSNKAQKLSAQIKNDFPQRYSVHGKKELIIHVELVTALASDPKTIFPHTFRVRSNFGKLNVRKPPIQQCELPASCPLSVVNSFVDNETCTHPSCDVTPEMVFYRSEQKLVDSMITVDLIHFAMNKSESLVLVSGDDDMWPGIRYALLQDASIIHLVPKVTTRRGTPYKSLIMRGYSSDNL